MSVIQILPEQEIKKIAAGEVVERPASVVKEMVENSLDAGATKIVLYIEKAGKRLIRVVDDGYGMSTDDAMLCFTNHATSKIKSLEDLNDIASFGFRGEALATISAVSKIVLQTCLASEDENAVSGIKLEYVDGKIVSQDDVACPVGTDFQVRDLFYNTPVRQKFLKQDETEWNQIQNLFQAFCLSNLDKHFQLYRDDRMIFNLPPVDNLKDRVMQLWGHNMAQNLVEVSGDGITGLISDHNFWRYGRQQIFFFVNGRWVKNGELGKALLKGYRNVLPPARFPAAFLFFTIEQSMVDINVHPRKEEVRFAKPVSVAKKLQALVTCALEGLINKQLGSTHVTFEQPVHKQVSPEQILPEQVSPEPAEQIMSEPLRSGQVISELPHRPPELVINRPLGEQKTVVADAQPTFKIIGQLLGTYIVIENDDGLLLIDQHAAHERILYEKYLKNFEQKDGTRLLFPEIIKLSEQHMSIVLSQKDFLRKQGIEVELIGDLQLAIKTSPPKVQNSSLRELIFEMIEFVEENNQLEEEIFRKKLNEHMHGQLACKMAIKAGDTLSLQMMHNIVTELQEVDNRFICVHGRPTTWSVSKAELEKRFRRRS